MGTNEKTVIEEILDSWKNLSAKQLAKDIAGEWRVLLAVVVAIAFLKPTLDLLGWQDTIICHLVVNFSLVFLVIFIIFIIESTIKAIRHDTERTDTAD